MSVKNYPYIGLFTNNPYDIRGLEFIELYKTNRKKLYKKDGNKKILKYKYYKLLEEHRSFILKLFETSENDPNNPFLQKWLFDFFSRFINFDSYKVFNVFINYENSFIVVKQIIEEIKLNKEEIKDFIKADQKEIPTDLQLREQQQKITDLVMQIANYIEIILLEFDQFYDNENETSIKLIEKPTAADEKKAWNNFNIDIDFSLDSTFIHNSFDSNFKRSIERALNINSNLNKKYELYFKLQKYNNNIKSNIYFDTAIRLNQIDYTLEHCLNLFLNIDTESCDILFVNAMSENEYGPYCKELFENDEHFIIWERITYFKKLNRVNIKYIMKMLEKLQFKIKVKILKENPKIISIPDSFAVKSDLSIKSKENKNIPTYVRFYENFDSWSKHQTVSKKLNNQPHLKEYLNTCINIINRRITYLNPNYKDFIDFGNKYFNNLNTNDKDKFVKITYKKILELLNSDDVELDQVIINLQKNKNNLKSIFTENNNVIDYNYLNNIGLIITMLNNPSENNITQLSYLLNNSYKFNKALFEF